jgi:5-methylthioadenosine/S-adenosylhomocysteine deaminase
MADILIVDAIVFTINSHDEIIPNGAVLVRDGRIEAVGCRNQIGPIEDVEIIACAGRKAVLPGLIDAHFHSSLMRGVNENRPLIDWLPHYQLEHRALTEEDAFHAARLCYLEALKSGTTTVLDMYRYMHRCADAAAELGIRVNLAPYVADMPGKNFFATIAENERLIATHHGSRNGRVQVWMGLEHLFYCTRDAYRNARRMSDEHGIRMHTHASELQEEEQAVLRRFGKRSIPLLHQYGFLGPKTAIAHGVWLSQDDISLLADTGTAIVHCPCSNAKVASGIAPVIELRGAGVTVALGSDGNVCNNSVDLFEEMKFGSLLQKAHRLDATALPARDMLRMATIEGARALGLERQIGSIEPGKKADLILVDLDQPNMRPLTGMTGGATNVLWNLVFSARGSNVSTVMIDGRVVLQDGRSILLDERAVIDGAQAQMSRLMERCGALTQHLVPMLD